MKSKAETFFSAVICEVANQNSYMSPGEYGIGWNYMDGYKKTAIDLHRRIEKTAFYGKGFWLWKS